MYTAGAVMRKTSPELFAFIENFEEQYTVPLEPIYTGKMMFGLFDLIKKQLFSSEYTHFGNSFRWFTSRY